MYDIPGLKRGGGGGGDKAAYYFEDSNQPVSKNYDIRG